MLGKSSPILIKKIFDYEIRFQNLLINVFSDYINSDLSKIDELINQSLNQITNLVGADRSVIYSYDFKNKTCSNTYEYCTQNTESLINVRQNIPLDYITHILEEHKKGNSFYVSNVDFLSDEYDSDLKSKLKHFGVKSLITVPKYYKSKLIGFIGFESFTKAHLYSEAEKNLFIIYASMLVNIMQRKKYEDFLQQQEIQNFKTLRNLQKKTKEVNDYMHLVSHELKAPLVSMHNLLGWYIEDHKENLSENELSQLKEIVFHVEKMDAITQGILEYSNVDKVKLSEKKIDINRLISSIIKNNSITAEVIVQKNLPNIVGNYWRLTQIFNNLIENAIKFNDSKKPIIYIGFEDKKKYYEFFVKDNGKGIDKEYHSKIFEVFRKLDDTNANTGLGLSIVKRIVEYYKGSIWVESKKGFGSTFYFTLPKKRSTNLIRFLKKKINTKVIRRN